MVKWKSSETEDHVGEELRRHHLPENFFTPEDSIAHVFTVISNRVSHVLEKMYRERFQLTVVGWRLLAIIRNHAPLSAKSLAEISAMDQVSITRALDQLVGKKFVSRRTDRRDRRRVVLRLTKRGEAVYNDIVPLSYAADKAIMSDLSDDERHLIREMVQKVAARTAETMSDEVDWLAILSQFGYQASGTKSECSEAIEQKSQGANIVSDN
ncbi:hypothetical protein A8B82_15955 [Sulfitobacter sp. EhC04]|uniref:MarR family winged helix-turn-helix transcriptional regulator n=1 Tax=Sulfitobacter sp. EhC04 TaxID=1849168 RepID=UPI0007F54814|nr:MarR family winged helix-turn-helix transcriptional regulator [Sulfitobacter sp. EhC04]OAN76003.1 hypothetical protein A8B82_15955 [Sulfitobacter sp. EhC04]